MESSELLCKSCGLWTVEAVGGGDEHGVGSCDDANVDTEDDEHEGAAATATSRAAGGADVDSVAGCEGGVGSDGRGGNGQLAKAPEAEGPRGVGGRGRADTSAPGAAWLGSAESCVRLASPDKVADERLSDGSACASALEPCMDEARGGASCAAGASVALPPPVVPELLVPKLLADTNCGTDACSSAGLRTCDDDVPFVSERPAR
mmetsp:Transcript_54968/g.119885  ORF Transcript_54968/g.119885 Transcript_54968/m.119885 type:complete len:205 (-) Transcript_54968:1783-2397(-)